MLAPPCAVHFGARGMAPRNRTKLPHMSTFPVILFQVSPTVRGANLRNCGTHDDETTRTLRASILREKVRTSSFRSCPAVGRHQHSRVSYVALVRAWYRHSSRRISEGLSIVLWSSPRKRKASPRRQLTWRKRPNHVPSLPTAGHPRRRRPVFTLTFIRGF
ncbi:hypothetical protein EI94DRAFT_607242 [Lactarius quietus]|nr:hypothetical protein EI94DRAFT_607242 [Lactarius quietus]